MMTPGPCAKQTVTATIVLPGGSRFVGTNHCYNAQQKCPRAGMPTGMGYELCRDICQQPGHAEVQALMCAALAGYTQLDGGVCFIEGHTYACASCIEALRIAGVEDIAFGPPPPAGCAHCTCYGEVECYARRDLRILFVAGPERDRLMHKLPPPEESLNDFYVRMGL